MGMCQNMLWDPPNAGAPEKVALNQERTHTQMQQIKAFWKPGKLQVSIPRVFSMGGHRSQERGRFVLSMSVDITPKGVNLVETGKPYLARIALATPDLGSRGLG